MLSTTEPSLLPPYLCLLFPCFYIQLAYVPMRMHVHACVKLTRSHHCTSDLSSVFMLAQTDETVMINKIAVVPAGVRGYMVGPCQGISPRNHTMPQPSIREICCGRSGRGRWSHKGREIGDRNEQKERKRGQLGTCGNRERGARGRQSHHVS